MNTPQSAIIPENITSALFIEAKILKPQAIAEACRQSLSKLQALQSQFPNDFLGMTLAFGADFWKQLNHHNEGQELKNFVPLGNGLAPATQQDLLIHIQSTSDGVNAQLAHEVLGIFADHIHITSDNHGYRLPEKRGWDGFVDSTENPHEIDEIKRIGTIGDDAPDAGGSYVLLQKYVHDLKKWDSYSIPEQEESVARTKIEDIEFPKSERLARSHIGRTNLKENGVGLKIVRRSLPFGTASGEKGLMFIAYCARLHNIEKQLLMMFGETDGETDLLLERLTQAVSGAYYFAPSVERLQNL